MTDNTNELKQMLQQIASAVSGLSERLTKLESGDGEGTPDSVPVDIGRAKPAEIAADSVYVEMQAQKKMRDELRLREAALDRRMRASQPKSRTEEAQLAAFQAKADGVLRDLGEGSAPTPYPLEGLAIYRRRVLGKLTRYSPKLKGLPLTDIDDKTLAQLEPQIFADAQAEALRPTELTIPPQGIVERKSVSPGGHKISEFYGRESFVVGMKPVSRIVKLMDPRKEKLRALLADNNF
jgi:hypothetical protein